MWAMSMFSKEQGTYIVEYCRSCKTGTLILQTLSESVRLTAVPTAGTVCTVEKVIGVCIILGFEYVGRHHDHIEWIAPVTSLKTAHFTHAIRIPQGIRM